MTKLKISPTLSLPADAATSTIVVYGGKGMGKTNLASVLVEEFDGARIRFALLDPMGVSWGLRHGENGKGNGIEVLILGGVHGDMPIEPTSGAVVADLVVDEDVSVIIDISRRADGSMWSISERIRFVTAFAKRLYQRQGEKRRPLNLVIDEAARFAPQVVRHGESELAACIGAIAVLVEEGRNVGIGVTLVTQRSARLNKDVAELADCMFAFRTVGPNSMRAVLDWLGEHVEKSRLKELGEKLRSLPRGSALVVSPGWLEFEGIVAIRKRETFDSSATPKAGSSVRVTGPGAKPDLAKYRERMAEVIEQATANDPKALKARIAELEKDVTRIKAAALERPAPRMETKVVEKQVIKEAQLQRIGVLVEQGEKVIERLWSGLTGYGDTFEKSYAKVEMTGHRLEQAISDLRAVVRTPNAPTPAPTPVPAPRLIPQRTASMTRRAETTSAGDAPACTGALRRIMIALAQHPDGLTDQKIGVYSGVSTKGGSFRTYLSRARGAGWFEDVGGAKRITDTGLEALGGYEPLPMGAELASYWMNELGGSCARILKVLVDAHPNALDHETIGERAGVSIQGGSYRTYLSRLRSRDLIEDVHRGSVKASDSLRDGAQ